MNRPSALSFIGLLCACQGSRTGDLGIDLVLSAHDDNTLSAEATVTLDEEGSVHLEFWNDQVDPLRTLESAADTHHTLDVVGMRADSSYTLQAVATLADGTELRGETTTFSTGSLPVELPPLEVVTGQGESAAMTLLGPAMDRADGDYESTDFAFLTGVDREGEVVWYYEGDDLDLGPNHAGELLADGSLQILGKSQVLGVSPAGETLWSIDTELAGTVHHDAATLSNGNVVVMTQEVQTHQVEDLGGEVPLIGDVLHELDNDGEVVWSWSTFDHLDVERFPGELSRLFEDRVGGYDWTHANAVFHVADQDALLVSLRHQNQVLLIDHASGDVIWILGEDGDFELVEGGEWFTSQHAATITSNGDLLLYDNGNEKSPAYSRSVRYRLDTDNWTAEQNWEWDTDLFTENLGDSDALEDGRVLVCAGGKRDTPNARLADIDTDGEVTWELTVKENLWTYRAERVDWVGPVD